MTQRSQITWRKTWHLSVCRWAATQRQKRPFLSRATRYSLDLRAIYLPFRVHWVRWLQLLKRGHSVLELARKVHPSLLASCTLSTSQTRHRKSLIAIGYQFYRRRYPARSLLHYPWKTPRLVWGRSTTKVLEECDTRRVRETQLPHVHPLQWAISVALQRHSIVFPWHLLPVRPTLNLNHRKTEEAQQSAMVLGIWKTLVWRLSLLMENVSWTWLNHIALERPYFSTNHSNSFPAHREMILIC